MVFLGNPEYGCELEPIAYAAFARACGAAGFTTDNPRDVRRVLDQGLATSGPVVVDAIGDPSEPPMPGKVSARQAARFARVTGAWDPEPGQAGAHHRLGRDLGDGVGKRRERWLM